MVNEVKVLGKWASPYAMRPRIALHLKSVDCDYVEETMQPKSELLLKSNPVHKKVPVLLHNDKPLCESRIIVEYIDDVFSSGQSILPSDTYDRAIQRFWAAYLDDKWFPTLLGVVKAQTEEAKNAGFEQVKEGLSLLEDAFDKCSKGKSYFSGDKIGYLDIAFGSFLGWLHVCEKINNIELISHEKTPKLHAWAEKFCADEAVKDYMPETEKLMGFAKVLIAKSQAASSN